MIIEYDDIYNNYVKSEVLTSDIESIADSDHIYDAAMKCNKGTDWKESVQRYNLNLLINLRNSQKDIRENKYKSMPFVEFQLNERGRIRDVKSLHIKDRVVQKSLNDNVLMPAVLNKLIYNNGASVEGKGLSFARKRFEIDLRNAYIDFGENTWVLFIDFSKYFDNISHAILLDYYSNLLSPSELQFIASCFKEFEIDVSYMTDEEFDNCMNVLFNSIEYAKLDKSLFTGEKFMPKSVGIGSQMSQIAGIFYPHRLDNYCKIVKGIKYYGRYMDDSYIILDSREAILEILNEILVICKEIGIFINPRKLRIQNVKSTITTYLKMNYIIKDTGGLIRMVHSDNFRREHRRITKFYHLYINGRAKLDDIILWYKSWRGTFYKYDSKLKIHKLDQYFCNLFNLDFNFNPISNTCNNTISNSSTNLISSNKVIKSPIIISPISFIDQENKK